MKILIALSTKDDPALGLSLLAEDYPDAVRVCVAGREDLLDALQQENFDLAILQYHLDWIQRQSLLDLIQHYRPGLPAVLVTGNVRPDAVDPQAALRQNRQTIKALLNNPYDLILLFDPHRRAVLANPTFYQRSGKQPDEVHGRTSIEILPPPLGESRDAAVRRVIETGETIRFEDRGVESWFDITIFPICDEQGQVINAMAYAHDITDRKTLENQLRASHATIDALLDNPNDVILLLDRDGKILTANETFCQRIQIDPEDVIGRSMQDFLPPDLWRSRFDIIEQVFETGQVTRFEDQGVTGWFDNSVFPIRDDQNQVTSVAIVGHDITERKQLEEALRRDQRVMLAMANAPNDIFLLLDRSGIILTANEVVAQSVNRELDELPGLCFWDLLQQPIADFRRTIFERVLQTGIAERLEDRGRLGVYDSQVIPITDDQGEIIQVVIQARDISERKQMELALKRSEERYRTFFETSTDGIVYAKLDGRLEIVNQQFARLFGYEGPEEIYNLNVKGTDLIVADDHGHRSQAKQTVLEGKLLKEASFEARRKDGSLFQIEVNATLVNDPDGKPAGFFAICRDVTERKQMEFALQESEKRYRTLVETSPDAIILHDNEGQLLLVNQEFVKLFGFEDVVQVLGSNLNTVDLIVEQDIPRMREFIKIAFQEGQIDGMRLTAHRKDGSQFYLEANGSVIYDSQGKPTGFLAICRDVTERYRIQEELVKAHELLEHRVIERTAELQAMNRQLRKEIFLRKQAEDQWKRHALQSEALARVASRANTHLDLKAVMEAICEEIIRAMPYPISSVSLYQEKDDCLHITAYASRVTLNSFEIPPVPRAMYEEYVRLLGPTIVIPDAAEFQLTSDMAHAATPNIRTIIIMPFYDQVELIGSLNMASVGEIRLPTDTELDLLRAISDQVVLSITNSRLFERVSESQVRLRYLTERLVEVQEAEKRHLARELHDHVGQMLTSLSLNLEIVTRLIRAGDTKTDIQNELEKIRGQVKELLNQVRELSLDLLPAMLDDLGLLPAILDHCQRFTAQTGIRVNLTHRGLEERAPAQIEVATYRIIQEALTNVARHARVDQVEVRIWAGSNELGVQICDQGVGFDLLRVERTHHSSGISSMSERAANCGGVLEIETGPGRGTCVTVEFQLDGHNQPEVTI